MKHLSTVLSLTVLAAVAGCGPKKPTATILFSSLRQPTQPLSEQYMKIAVRNAQMKGDTGEYDQTKWSKMTADLLRYYLQEASEQHGVPIKLVDRQHVAMAMEEKDLAAAGITDNGDDVASAAIKGANAVVTSLVTIKIDKQVGKKRSIKAMNLFAHAWSHGGGGGGGVDTEQVDEEARNITVQCQFQLKDAGSNDIVVSHSTRPSQDFTRTKASSFFGSSKTEADMEPRDKVIGGMIETHVLDFLAKFIPTESRFAVQVKSSGHEMSREGVRILVYAETPEQFAQALTSLKQAIAEDPDDHRSLFAAGVCCEKLNKTAEARKYYRQAASLSSKDPQYAAAVARVSGMG